jgi:hypothetical protein
MRCLVAAGKHVNDIRTIARQRPLTTTIQELLGAVFPVASVPRLYIEDPGRLSEVHLSEVK